MNEEDMVDACCTTFSRHKTYMCLREAPQDTGYSNGR